MGYKKKAIGHKEHKGKKGVCTPQLARPLRCNLFFVPFVFFVATYYFFEVTSVRLKVE